MNLTLLDIPELFGFSIEVYFIVLIIAIPTFFFWKWLFKKFIKTERTRLITTWAATLIMTPVIYVGLILLIMFGITYTPSKDFNQSEWLEDKEGRFQMADDIIQSKMLIGKDTNQVKQILGEPTWDGDTTRVWSYDMGFGGGGLGFLFYHLNLKLDKDKKVTSVEHQKIRD